MVSPRPAIHFAPIDAALDRIAVGLPLLIDIYEADKVLLLARGKVVESESQLKALIERGSLVDIEEVRDARQLARYAPRTRLPQLWERSTAQINSILSTHTKPPFESRLQSTLPIIEELVARDPDLAIFQVVRQSTAERSQHAARQSMLTASVVMMVARRLGWTGASIDVSAKCALTMNIAIPDLLGKLAARQSEPHAKEREVIADHPTRGRKILEDAGVSDRDWLRGVAEHHERPDGSGYPLGLKDVSETSQLVQCADVLVCSLRESALGAPVNPSDTLRKLYLDNPGSPFVAALVKELGVYPTGSIVRSASGEVGMVVSQGPTSTTPVVAVVPMHADRPLLDPVYRRTEESAHAITGVLPGWQFSPGFCRQLFALYAGSS